LIQVVDVATPPERPSKPHRGTTAALATLGGLLLLTFVFVFRRLKANSKG
jgi:uncharacterized protein involved in exopolysaccharide biosynthesis